MKMFLPRRISYLTRNRKGEVEGYSFMIYIMMSSSNMNFISEESSFFADFKNIENAFKNSWIRQFWIIAVDYRVPTNVKEINFQEHK